MCCLYGVTLTNVTVNDRYCSGPTCWSRKMSLRSRLARNMKTLLNILTSVMELGGSECATATRPTF